MPTINSPISNKSFQGTSNMREFVVPDGNDEPEMQMPQMGNPFHHEHHEHNGQMHYAQHAPQQPVPFESGMQMRKQKNNKISDAGRKRVEMLCGMSSLNKEVKIGENAFVLRTLKSKENRTCLAECLKFDGTVEFTFELRRQILARSIVSVSGIELENFLGSFELDAKLEFIDELDDLIIDKLYGEYLALNKEVKDKFSLNSENIKETVEEIKKS